MSWLVPYSFTSNYSVISHGVLLFCSCRSQLFHTRSSVLCLHKKINSGLQPFLIYGIFHPKQYPLFPEETWAQLKSSFCSSTHTSLSGWYPSTLSSAKPKPHQQQESLKVKAPDLKVGHRPDTGRGDTLHCYFWVALLLKTGAPTVLALVLGVLWISWGNDAKSCGAVCHNNLQTMTGNNLFPFWNSHAIYIYSPRNIIH